jgi:hypothetical protein
MGTRMINDQKPFTKKDLVFHTVPKKKNKKKKTWITGLTRPITVDQFKASNNY